ncbi:MAG: 4-hydroxy-3-methylbut-2-en-1-yl diphosphate synthase (ferredoxin) [Chlamydiae bacterium]|nr:4-hydroxy-3-methylbut-2-en-1-yl diphosphate synthase (ferredoxin) [Chlamydiota bacterium]
MSDNLFRAWKTREVKVGSVGVGGDNPVRVQSMTTSDTRDAKATIDQIVRLADCGSEIARITVQGMKEADTCEEIKNGLVKRGYDIPLVADIHFYPPAAVRVVDFVDKVRVNPGNFVDRRATFKMVEYDDDTYAREIVKIEEKFGPLVEKCLKLGRAMRIGTNHGSLSDRIMNRFGDTPFGMVESALEFARVCRKFGYHDFMFSMKASNPLVMIEAYRLLVAEMMKLGWDYPLHLGVTEAGEGEDGRIKSSVGIGALLLDGIGDTIRVSLTEDPWCEIDPCQRLVRFAASYQISSLAPTPRKVALPQGGILHRDGSVFLHVTEDEMAAEGFYEAIGCKVQFGRPEKELSTVDGLILEEVTSEVSEKALRLQEAGVAIFTRKSGGIPIVSLNESLPDSGPYALMIEGEEGWDQILQASPVCIFLAPIGKNRLHLGRTLAGWLKERSCELPVIFAFDYAEVEEDLVIHAATEMGALLADSLGEGVALKTRQTLLKRRQLSFNLLQACRMRTTKTEFISCPGCGRTLFDLQEVASRIRSKTAHLPGVKIAIMGCIVNGPGEMADADFGYVGSRAGKIDLYVGKTCVERGIDFADADDRLIELIKAHNRWAEIS